MLRRLWHRIWQRIMLMLHPQRRVFCGEVISKDIVLSNRDRGAVVFEMVEGKVIAKYVRVPQDRVRFKLKLREPSGRTRWVTVSLAAFDQAQVGHLA